MLLMLHPSSVSLNYALRSVMKSTFQSPSLTLGFICRCPLRGTLVLLSSTSLKSEYAQAAERKLVFDPREVLHFPPTIHICQTPPYPPPKDKFSRGQVPPRFPCATISRNLRYII
ncbi:hypothetical protein EVAR_93634_1 [Eumeta japonica]|uniref:Uncharacterized protein n=1 Tax=Eumeta variegata TaxID=151549 RepID=A0A4C1TQS2_EUMVA|nr:hypothetical protein EVAR_93634_1 [Eumeta japonica]